MRAGQGRRHGQQAAALPARRGAVRDRPRARGAGCASRRRSPGPCRSSGCSRNRSRRRRSSASTGSSTARPTSSSREMARGSSYAEALAEAQRLGYAEADPSDDVTGRDAAAKMAILARLAFGTPVHLDDVRYEGIEHLHERRPRVRPRARPGAEADRHRRAPPGRPVGARAPDLPLLRASAGHHLRSVQRRHGRVRGDHRDHPVRPRRRRAARPPARCSATSSA